MTTARKYKSYPKYKPSNINWLDDVPDGWEVKRIRFILNLVGGNGFPEELQGKLDGDYPFYKVSDINGDQTNLDISNNYVDKADVAANNWKIVPKGSIVTAKIGAALSLNHRKITTIDSLIDNNMLSLSLKSRKIDLKYIFYLFKVIDLDWYVNPGAVPSVNMRQFIDDSLPIPKIEEQKEIVTFLDRETEKIDSVVEKKQKLVELLKEKRQALITRAVTKGLNPKAKMKPSGIDWLGEIPEGWEVRRIKMLCKVSRGASPRPIDDEKYFDDNGEYAWVRIADLTASDRYLDTTTQRLSNLGKSLSVPLEPGEIFLSIAGTVGNSIITKIKCCIHDGFVYFINLKYNRELLWYIFVAGEAYKGLGKLGTQLNLNTDTVGNISIPIMSGREQEEIVTFLDEETGKIDGIINKVALQIEKLQEYRQALISNAVTGKIKV